MEKLIIKERDVLCLFTCLTSKFFPNEHSIHAENGFSQEACLKEMRCFWSCTLGEKKLPLDETNRWDIPGADGLVPDESSCGQLTVCTNYLCGSRGLAETKDWREFKEQFIVLRVFSVEHWTKLRPYCRLSDSHALSPMMQQTLCGREKERLNNIFMRVLHFFRARQLP